MELESYEMARLLFERARNVTLSGLNFEEKIIITEKIQYALDEYKKRIISEEIEKRKEKVYRATEAVEEMRKYK